jgi:lipoprotein-anchoring transpeptidase ErfK/SrfK
MTLERGMARKARRWGIVAATVGAMLAAGCSATSQASQTKDHPSSSAAKTASTTKPSAGKGKTDDGSQAPPTTTSAKPTTPPPPPTPPSVASSPKNGATGINPMSAISLTSTHGTLQTVALTNKTGHKVIGKLSTNGQHWTVGEPLGYGKTYTWSGKAVGERGTSTPIKGSFTTLEPADEVTAKFGLYVHDGSTVGVGAPIIVQFNGTVTNKAEVEKHLQVISDPPTVGSWGWEGTNEVGSVAHFRPKNYWKAGTKITVKASLYGVPYDDQGSYGAESQTFHLTVGRSQITYGNVKTHRLVVKRDGKTLWNWPVSFGMDSVWSRMTPVGNYVTMEKYEIKTMTSPTWHYREDVPWATRIGNNGIFIHGMESTVDVQGVENVSHGCANLSPERAHAYYNAALFGDPVIITDPGQNAPTFGPDDSDIWDWTVSWTDWQKLSALH